MLQGFGIGAGRERKEAGRSPTVLPFGSLPLRATPRGGRLGEAGGLGLTLTLGYGVTLRAEGFTHTRWWGVLTRSAGAIEAMSELWIAFYEI
jgi:hypothetical protein